MGNYQKLVIWQKAMDLADTVFELTDAFPEREHYGLASQMRRCAASFQSNIAEGSRMTSPKHWLHFLAVAHGSASERETQLLIAQRRSYCDGPLTLRAQAYLNEILKILNTLMNKNYRLQSTSY